MKRFRDNFVTKISDCVVVERRLMLESTGE